MIYKENRTMVYALSMSLLVPSYKSGMIKNDILLYSFAKFTKVHTESKDIYKYLREAGDNGGSRGGAKQVTFGSTR